MTVVFFPLNKLSLDLLGSRLITKYEPRFVCQRTLNTLLKRPCCRRLWMFARILIKLSKKYGTVKQAKPDKKTGCHLLDV